MVAAEVAHGDVEVAGVVEEDGRRCRGRSRTERAVAQRSELGSAQSHNPRRVVTNERGGEGVREGSLILTHIQVLEQPTL